jgi:hypothetical protein
MPFLPSARSMWWRTGRANAAVFPDPVSARPMMSSPERATGMALAWIGVGFFHPINSPVSMFACAVTRVE